MTDFGSEFGSSSTSVFEDLPKDPEQAFLALEEYFRLECEAQVRKAHNDENLNVYYVNYIAQVIGAINELGLQAQFADRVPLIEDVGYSTYLNFSKDVKHYRTTLLIRHGRRVQGYSVRFDPATKVKVRHHIEQLRGIFENLEVEQEKRQALFNKRRLGQPELGQSAQSTIESERPLPNFRSALENGLHRLFHYQPYKFEYLQNTIRRRLIRFSRAGGFNDPWDCKPSFSVPEDKDELDRLVQYMHVASEKHSPRMDPAEREARTKHYLDNPTALRADLVNASAEMWAQMERRYRIYCLSTRPDVQLMWGHYADHHRGVCLEFDVRTPDFSSAIQVNYNAAYPKFSLADDADISPFHTKSSDWAYEEEYRLIAQEAGEALVSGTLTTRDDGFFQFSERALVSVIIGSSATRATAHEIDELARASGVLVRTATRMPHRYELTFNPPLARRA